MSDFLNLVKLIARKSRSTLQGRNRRITIAVLAGGATIAAVDWLSMSHQPGEPAIGLIGRDTATGTIIAPAYGGAVTGIIAGLSRRPVYEDGRAGTFAAFTGVFFFLAAVLLVRSYGDLPAGGEAFSGLGIAALLGPAFLVIGFANMFVAFPAAFIMSFVLRSIMPGNENKYGWQSDDPDNPGLVYVTPGPPSSSTALISTAFSRFSSTPSRFSAIPPRHRPDISE